ncbi:protein-tyrosine phosphatase-like protein [Lentinula aciculospora]|uniref:Protein-tyrosine phosphatase-like protein n=1 Tax=Lentinula aciculospora TaxID=153920 RepID=A0A9W9DHF0_9AGAR|nr:protein-tyrosine phosphatase-like protein [Lentinula aciculospora]
MSTKSSKAYDLEDLLPRWLLNAYTAPHIQSALTILDEREDARAGKGMTSKAVAAVEANSSHLLNSTSNFYSSESTNFYSIVSGTSPENRLRNRYMDVLPYDRTRVKVQLPYFQNSGGVHAPQAVDEHSEGLYVNANWVQEKYGRKWWIASQAPLRNTAYTFLSLLLEDVHPTTSTTADPSSMASTTQHIHWSCPRTVVQLTQNVESGRRKAHPYFPDVVGQTMIVVPDLTDLSSPSPSTFSISRSKLKVTLVAQEEIREACCVKSIVEVRPFSTIQPAIQFTHLLFVAWPDQSVPSPSDRAALFEFVRLVNRVNRQKPLDPSSSHTQKDDPPIIVGCSAGIGRTGSFIAMNSLLRHAGFLPPHEDSVLSQSRSSSPSSFHTSQSVLLPHTSTTPSDTSINRTSNTPLGPLPATLSTDLVSQEIDSLREQRAGMVQRPEQAMLVYEMMVGAYVERGDLKR